MKKLSYLALAIATLFISHGTLHAQITFSSCDDWNAARCGNLIEDTLASAIETGLTDLGVDPSLDAGLFPAVNPTDLGWGTLTSLNLLNNTLFHVPSQGLQGYTVGNQQLDANGNIQESYFLDIDSSNGDVEGFCLSHSSVEGLVVNIYDGTTIVDTLTIAGDAANSVNETGWLNSAGSNVTRVEIFAPDADPNSDEIGFILSTDFSFGTYCPPVDDPSSFDELTQIKEDIQDLLDNATGNDVCYLESALDCVCWMQSDCFWETDNRLSQYGGTMFYGAAYVVAYLEWTNDPQSDVIIDALMETLEQIVDDEIAYAIANGGNECYIDRAEDFAELGDIIDDDFDCEFVATLAYRLAWLHAYYSTY